MAPPSTGTGFRGSLVARGPMASDQFTKIHNLAVRGAIPTKYVGVFGFISSHEKGWKLTTASVATQLEVGPDFVTAALHAIEKAGCLIRGRLRDSAGKVRGSVWFVTDLALQLREVGIDDEAMIREQVTAAYEKWIAENAAALFASGEDGSDAAPGAAEPNPENPVLVVTRENAGRAGRFRRSEPKRDSPDQAEPGQAETAHKKNNTKKNNTKKTNEEPGGTLPPDPRRTPAPPSSGQGTDSRDESSDPNQQPPLAVNRDSRPRVRETARPASAGIDDERQTESADGQDTNGTDGPAEASADAAGGPDSPRGENEAQSGRQGAARADNADTSTARDARTAARAVAAAARTTGRAYRTGRRVVPRQVTAPARAGQGAEPLAT